MHSKTKFPKISAGLWSSIVMLCMFSRYFWNAPCRWKHLPQMLLCSLGRSCLALLSLTFLAIHDIWVKGSCVSLGCRLVLHAKSKYTLGPKLVFMSRVFFSIRIPGYFQAFGKKHPQALMHSGRCVIFEKKNPKFRLPRWVTTTEEDLPSPTHAPYSRARMYSLASLSLHVDWELMARM